MTMKDHGSLITLSKLPPFISRRVIFLSNIFSLFFDNTDQIKELKREVGALETYGGRMIPILDIIFPADNNLLLLEKKPDPHLIEYFRSLKLSLPTIEVVPTDFLRQFAQKKKNAVSLSTTLTSHPAAYLTGYVTEPLLLKWAHALHKKLIGTPAGFYHGNNKLELHRYLQKIRLPTFDTFVVKNKAGVQSALKKLKEKNYKFAVVKSPIGASGIGMKKIPLNGKYPLLPTYLFHEGQTMIQGWLDPHVPEVKHIASPSVLMFVTDEVVWIYDMTEQILSRQSVHEGNISPPPFLHEYPHVKNDLLSQAKKVGGWLQQQGYRGTASIDAHVIERRGSVEVRICEINARVTGATYPSLLAKKLVPHHMWYFRNIRFENPLNSLDLLNSMRRHQILFDLNRKEGVLPFNFNTDKKGQVIKGQYLFLGKDLARIYFILNEFQSQLASKGVFDRD